MVMEQKRIGIVGVGNIAVKHIRELQQVNECKIVALCDIDPQKLSEWGDKLDIPQDRRFTDYHDLVNCDAVEAVEVCTPNYLHIPVAVAAVQAGKAINVEKPLSVDLPSCESLSKALQKNPVPNMMCFSYRFMPAVRYAKWILERGLIGDIISLDVAYLKDSAFFEGRRLEWRFVKEYAGTGVLGDLGVHLIDMAELLVGQMKEVSAVTDIYIKKRKYLDSEEYGDVETDDYCSFLAKMENGIKGNFVITRCAVGQKNTIKYDIYGTKGMISFNLNDPTVLGICAGEVDYMSGSVHTVNVPNKFFINQEQAFVEMLSGKVCDYFPTVANGLRCQHILDMLQLSAQEERWVKL
jgi:predicted dehydrogenase